MPSLLELPLELVEQIISVLAEQKPPSATLLHEEPSQSLFRGGYHPLKDLSRVCHTTRELCFSTLFSAVKVNLDSIDGFLKFSECYSLFSHVDSLMLYIDPCSESEKPSHSLDRCLWLAVVKAIESVKPSVMTLVLPPSLFIKVLPYRLNLTDQWAFSLSYQTLQLRIPQHLALSFQTPQSILESRNIFQLRPWTHCAFNQGSSVKGYSSYEYFFKKTPSVFSPMDREEFIYSLDKDSFENLTSVDYIAVFPIDHIIRFCQCLNHMKKMKRLSVRFAPTPSNNILDDPIALGKCQPGDLWQELESCYTTLTRYIGIDWLPKTVFVDEFTSLDYVNPSLRELIDRIASQQLMRWGKWESDPIGGRWTRKEEGPEESNQQGSETEQSGGNRE